MNTPFFRKPDPSVPHKHFPVPVYLDDPQFARRSSIAWIGVVSALLVGFVLFAAAVEPAFASGRNLMIILQQVLPLGILSMAMLIAFSRGGFDFSIGAIMSLCGGIFITVYNNSRSLLYAVSAAILTGLLIGIIHGIIVGTTGLAKFPGFLVTIITAVIIRSLSSALHNGNIIMFSEGADVPSYYNAGWFILVPLAVFLIIWLQFPGLAGKPDTAFEGRSKISQIVRFGYPFVITGTLAAFVGILYTFRLHVSTPSIGSNSVPEVFLVLILGGTYFGGKYGNTIATLIAAFFSTMAMNFLIINNFGPNFQSVLQIVLLLTAFGLLIGFTAIAGSMYKKKA